MPRLTGAEEAWIGANDLPYELDPVCQVLVTGKGSMTLSEIGICLGMCRERVRQIEAEAFAKFVDGLLSEGHSRESICAALRVLVQERGER